MINSENQATRKGLDSDRVAVCPKFGCETVNRLKPLKLGIFGFKKYPICKVHKIPLVFIDEYVGDFLQSVHACLFDRSLIPPKELLDIIRIQYPENLLSLFHSWMYCSVMGRGAKEIPSYMDSLSKAYIKSLNNRQEKSLHENSYKKKRVKLILLGFKKVEIEYIEFLKKFYDKHQILYDKEKIKPFPLRVKLLIQDWLINYLKTIDLKNFCSNEIDEQHSIKIKKTICDQILRARTCMLLLGLSTSKFSIEISVFELFAAYHEFLEDGLCFKYDSSNHIVKLEEIRSSINNSLSTLPSALARAR